MSIRSWRGTSVILLVAIFIAVLVVPSLADVVRVQPVPALDDLTDVTITGVSNNDTVVWNATLSQWINSSILDVVQSDLSALQDDVTTLQGLVSSLSSNVSDLEATVAAINSTIENIEADITALNSSITSMQGDISTLQSDVSTLQSDVSTLQSDVSTLQSDVSTLQSDVSTLQSDVSALQSTVSSLQTQVDGIASNVTALQDTVANLELDDLVDVDASSPSNDDVLIYNSTSSTWENEVFGGSSLWEVSGGDTQLISADDIDFQGYKAIALVCDNGATVPAAPTRGQWFLHTPAGRNVLMQYDGSNWIAIISMGAMTVYVDKTDGTDDLAHGTGVDGDAFATLQYAVNCIPGLYSGNVIIYANDEDYAEYLIVDGKKPTGDYTIKIYGTLTELETVSSATVATGSGATQGTVTKTGAFAGDSYANKLCYFVTDAAYRLIDSHTDDVLTLVGLAPSSTAQDVKIYDWGTATHRIDIRTGQYGVYFYDFKLYTGQALKTEVYSELELTRCSFTVGVFYWHQGNIVFDYCYLTAAQPATLAIQRSGFAKFRGSKICNTYDLGRCLWLTQGARLDLLFGSILDGDAGGGNKATYGIVADTNSVAQTYTAVSQGYCRIRNCDTGIYACEGGQVKYTSTIQYSGNGVDETAIAASYGYID